MGSKKFEDLTGLVFGNLTVVEYLGQSGVDSGQRLWRCECSCGNSTDRTVGSLKSQKGAKSCGCLKNKRLRSKYEHPAWAGCGDLDGGHWGRIVAQAKKRDKSFNLTIEQAWHQFESQGGRCALTGVPLQFATKGGETTASLDRVDNEVGYDEYNVQWVHKDINRMKNVHSQSHFIYLCQQVVDYDKEQKTLLTSWSSKE